MKQHGIRARGKRKFVVTTDSKHNLPIAPNLLNRDFQPAQPNAVWAGDITYIQTDEGWLYLAAVIDLYSRQVIDGACKHTCRPAMARLKELEDENRRLKKMYAEERLKAEIVQEALTKKW